MTCVKCPDIATTHVTLDGAAVPLCATCFAFTMHVVKILEVKRDDLVAGGMTVEEAEAHLTPERTTP